MESRILKLVCGGCGGTGKILDYSCSYCSGKGYLEVKI
jgi:DnaJ-class molecular chaperone